MVTDHTCHMNCTGWHCAEFQCCHLKPSRCSTEEQPSQKARTEAACPPCPQARVMEEGHKNLALLPAAGLFQWETKEPDPPGNERPCAQSKPHSLHSGEEVRAPVSLRHSQAHSRASDQHRAAGPAVPFGEWKLSPGDVGVLCSKQEKQQEGQRFTPLDPKTPRPPSHNEPQKAPGPGTG